MTKCFKILFVTWFELLVIGCFPSSPPPTVVVTCTLKGCFDTLSVTLDGKIPDDYILEATTSDGTTLSVRCVDDGNVETYHLGEPRCESRGVTFLDFAPDEVTITILWDGGNASQTFRPSYELSRPNGPDCEPECRSGGVVFFVPDGP